MIKEFIVRIRADARAASSHYGGSTCDIYCGPDPMIEVSVSAETSSEAVQRVSQALTELCAAWEEKP